MEDYSATVTPRQYFYENLSKVIARSKNISEVNEFISNPFHSLDKEPFNKNDRNFIAFILGNLEWMSNYEKDKVDLYYWINSMILNIGNGTV